MTVASSVLNYNGNEDTMECLDSLSRITWPDARVYAVDNGSKISPAQEIARRFPKVRVVENGANLGFTGGNNVGVNTDVKTQEVVFGAPLVHHVHASGIMDEIAIFRTDLSADDIKKVMNQGLAQVLAVFPQGKLSTTWASLKEMRR
jgi:hypothetical protein